MNYIKLDLRAVVLVGIAVLGFAVVFPEWPALKHIFLANRAVKNEVKLSSQQVRNSKEDSNVCTSQPTVRQAVDVTTTSQSETNTSNDGNPKVFISRDPLVFDDVCADDTLIYNIFAENIFKFMVVYDNPKSDFIEQETRTSVSSSNRMKLIVPSEWAGETKINVTGFSKGKVRLTMDEISFNIKKRKGGTSTTATAQKPKRFWVDVVWRDFEGIKQLTTATITNETIRLGSNGRDPESFLIKINVANLTPNSQIQLTNSNASVLVKNLSNKKKHEIVNRIANVKGVLVTGEYSNTGLPLTLNFVASNNPIDSLENIKKDIHTYTVKGEIFAKREL